MIRSMCRIAALLVLASPALRAQSPCHAENDGNNFNTLVSMGGPLLLGVRFTAPSSFSANKVEVFTGEGSGTNSVSIWSHDGVNNQPLTQFSSGSWSMSNANSWQGANLSSAVSLAGGTTYWMVWGPIGGSQASVDVPMGSLGQPYRASFNGGATWNGPFQFNDRHWKFRIYGNCAGAFTAFCFGDGTQFTACPCANNGLPGRGCENSASTGGAVLAASGSTSPDTVVLTASGELSTAPSIFLQGDVDLHTTGPGPVTFGDGVRCVGGLLLRLYVKAAAGGVVSAPAIGDPTITARSAALGDPIAPGTKRWYQVYYRDPNLGFCPAPPGNSWNVSSGIEITW